MCKVLYISLNRRERNIILSLRLSGCVTEIFKLAVKPITATMSGIKAHRIKLYSLICVMKDARNVPSIIAR